MKVIFIGSDRKIFEKTSSVRERNIEYGKLFGDTEIITVNRNSNTFEENISEEVKLHSVNSLFGAFKTARKISKGSVISTQDPFESGLVGVFLKLFCDRPLHLQLHTDFNNKYFLLSSPLNFVRFFLGHLVLPYGDSIRVVSERAKNSILDLNKRVEVLPIQVSIKNPEAIKKIPFSVLTVARLEKEKNLTVAIKAFAIAASNYKEAVFTIAGEGREKKNLENLVKELGIDSKVKFVGWVNNLEKLYGESEIYISTSLFEGYGMSIVEASQAKCALIISDTGVAGEIFKDGESAFISNSKNTESFAKLLEKLLSNSSLRLEMGMKAREAVEKTMITKEEYLLKYKQNIEEASLNFIPRGFFVRLLNLFSSILNGNRILRFIIAGTVVAVTQILLLYILTDILGIWYLFSSGLSFVYACIMSFLLQKFWAFRDHSMEGVLVQLLKFMVVVLTGILINTSLMFFWVDIAHIWYILAQFMTGLFIASVNFLMYRSFIFHQK